MKPNVHELDTNVEAFRRRPDQVVRNAELVPLGGAVLSQGPAGYRTAVAHINIGPEQDRTDGWGEVVLESPHNRPACRPHNLNGARGRVDAPEGLTVRQDPLVVIGVAAKSVNARLLEVERAVRIGRLQPQLITGR